MSDIPSVVQDVLETSLEDMSNRPNPSKNMPTSVQLVVGQVMERVPEPPKALKIGSGAGVGGLSMGRGMALGAGARGSTGPSSSMAFSKSRNATSSYSNNSSSNSINNNGGNGGSNNSNSHGNVFTKVSESANIAGGGSVSEKHVDASISSDSHDVNIDSSSSSAHARSQDEVNSPPPKSVRSNPEDNIDEEYIDELIRNMSNEEREAYIMEIHQMLSPDMIATIIKNGTAKAKAKNVDIEKSFFNRNTSKARPRNVKDSASGLPRQDTPPSSNMSEDSSDYSTKALAWTDPVDEEEGNPAEYSNARFDLNGIKVVNVDVCTATIVESLLTIMSDKAEAAGLASSIASVLLRHKLILDLNDPSLFVNEMFHHEREQNLPGYNLYELCEMLGSKVSTQRIIALQLFTCVFRLRDILSSVETYAHSPEMFELYESNTSPSDVSIWSTACSAFSEISSLMFGTDSVGVGGTIRSPTKSLGGGDKRRFVAGLVFKAVCANELPPQFIYLLQVNIEVHHSRSNLYELLKCVKQYLFSLVEESAFQSLFKSSEMIAYSEIPILMSSHQMRVGNTYEFNILEHLNQRDKASDQKGETTTNGDEKKETSWSQIEEMALECRWDRVDYFFQKTFLIKVLSRAVTDFLSISNYSLPGNHALVDIFSTAVDILALGSRMGDAETVNLIAAVFSDHDLWERITDVCLSGGSSSLAATKPSSSSSSSSGGGGGDGSDQDQTQGGSKKIATASVSWLRLLCYVSLKGFDKLPLNKTFPSIFSTLMSVRNLDVNEYVWSLRFWRSCLSFSYSVLHRVTDYHLASNLNNASAYLLSIENLSRVVSTAFFAPEINMEASKVSLLKRDKKISLELLLMLTQACKSVSEFAQTSGEEEEMNSLLMVADVITSLIKTCQTVIVGLNSQHGPMFSGKLSTEITADPSACRILNAIMSLFQSLLGTNAVLPSYNPACAHLDQLDKAVFRSLIKADVGIISQLFAFEANSLLVNQIDARLKNCCDEARKLFSSLQKFADANLHHIVGIFFSKTDDVTDLPRADKHVTDWTDAEAKLNVSKFVISLSSFGILAEEFLNEYPAFSITREISVVDKNYNSVVKGIFSWATYHNLSSIERQLVVRKAIHTMKNEPNKFSLYRNSYLTSTLLRISSDLISCLELFDGLLRSVLSTSSSLISSKISFESIQEYLQKEVFGEFSNTISKLRGESDARHICDSHIFRLNLPLSGDWLTACLSRPIGSDQMFNVVLGLQRELLREAREGDCGFDSMSDLLFRLIRATCDDFGSNWRPLKASSSVPDSSLSSSSYSEEDESGVDDDLAESYKSTIMYLNKSFSKLLALSIKSPADANLLSRHIGVFSKLVLEDDGPSLGGKDKKNRTVKGFSERVMFAFSNGIVRSDIHSYAICSILNGSLSSWQLQESTWRHLADDRLVHVAECPELLQLYCSDALMSYRATIGRLNSKVKGEIVGSSVAGGSDEGGGRDSRVVLPPAAVRAISHSLAEVRSLEDRGLWIYFYGVLQVALSLLDECRACVDASTDLSVNTRRCFDDLHGKSLSGFNSYILGDVLRLIGVYCSIYPVEGGVELASGADVDISSLRTTWLTRSDGNSAFLSMPCFDYNSCSSRAHGVPVSLRELFKQRLASNL